MAKTNRTKDFMVVSQKFDLELMMRCCQSGFICLALILSFLDYSLQSYFITKITQIIHPEEKMEVCVDNVQSFINAVEAGASRIELCSSLAEGGLTPSLGFFRQVKKIGNVQFLFSFMIKSARRRF